jgi:lysophospholipase L1-like esterase
MSEATGRAGLGRRVGANLALAASALLVAAVLGELSLRFLSPRSEGYFVYAPGEMQAGSPLADRMPGVEGVAEFRTNSLGIRGQEMGADGSEYRILAIGGSTSQNAYLDQSEDWPLVIADLLGPTSDGRRTWSGSVGRSGATARTNAVQMEYLVPSLPRVDAVVMLLGVNDLTVALRQGWAYEQPLPLSDPAAERLQMRQAFIRVPGRLQDQFIAYEEEGVPFYKKQALWHLARLSRNAWIMSRGGWSGVSYGWSLGTWRQHRSQASVIHDSLPPLEAPLVEYRGYLESITDMAEEYEVRLVLMTQPALWRPDLSSEEQSLIWLGGTGDFQNVPGQEYFTPGALAEGMRAYNEILLDVCAKRQVECVDLAASVPADTTMFYDDVHPTEAGARLFAETLADYLRALSPYGESGGQP